MRVGDTLQANVAERGLAFADDDRGAIDEDAVDEILRQESGRGGAAAFDEQVADVMKAIDIAWRTQGFPALDGVSAGQQSSSRRPILKAGKPHVQSRRIGEVGAASDQNHVGMGALEMNVCACILAGDPLRLA